MATAPELVQELVNQLNGKSWSVTGPDAGQCTAVPHEWQRKLGLPIVFGNAVDIYNNLPADVYNKELNGAANYPQPGAIIIWHQDPRVGTGQYGHVAVVISANVNTVTVLEQNNPVGNTCRVHTFPNYAGVTGWGRPHSLALLDRAEAERIAALNAPAPVVEPVVQPAPPAPAPEPEPVVEPAAPVEIPSVDPVEVDMPTPPAPGTIIEPNKKDDNVEQEVVQVPATTPKPGVKTTEFWVTLVLLALPVVNLILGTDLDANSATMVVTAIGTVLAAAATSVSYVQGRIDLKR